MYIRMFDLKVGTEVSDVFDKVSDGYLTLGKRPRS